MAGTIQGLTLFIGRVRNSTNFKEEEQNVQQELAKIRKYFSSKSLSAYDKKKCVWKLIYISILGYEIDLGHAECLQLIPSPKFSEKLAGYLTMALLFDENLLETHNYVHNCIKSDLQSGNEIDQSIALCALGNFSAKLFTEKFATIVARIAFGETGNTYYVQKRALACLTAFLRKNPAVYQETWAGRYRSLLQSRSIGVLMSACSYLMACGEKFGPSHLMPVADLIVSNLGKIVDNPMALPPDYFYHEIMCPWLQVKLLKLLQLLPPPAKESTLVAINSFLSNIITRIDVGSSINKNNAEHSVLFEAINVASHYGKYATSKLKHNVLTILAKYIAVREPNIRYLALEALAKLENTAEVSRMVAIHRNAILVSLRDRDLSIRRRALDVLFALCSKESAAGIVNELLEYLKEKDIHLKDELVLKIALLAEKYGENILWYIDVIMKILELAGDLVADDVWVRISQIVTGFMGGAEGNIETQRYAATKVFIALNTAHSHEPLVKLGAYLLGEYGELLVDTPGRGYQKQFEILTRHFYSCTPSGRSIILSALVKLAGKSPDTKESIISFIEGSQGHWDLDLQQRATEYLALLNSPEFEEKNGEVLDKVPAFPEDFLYNNVILKSLESIKEKKDKEKGKKEDNKSETTKKPAAAEMSKPQVVKASLPLRQDVVKALQDEAKRPMPEPRAVKPSAGLIDIEDTADSRPIDLKRYQTMSVPIGTTSHPFHARYSYKFAPEPTVDPGKVAKLQSPQENPDHWKRLISIKAKEGVVFENESVTIAMKGEYHRFTGRIILQFIAKRDRIENILTELQSPAGLEAQCSKIKYAENPMMMIQMMLAEPFDLPPILSVAFQAGGIQERVRFALPVLMTKFIEPVELPLAKFQEIWTDITINKPETFEKLDTVLKNPAPANLHHTDVLKRMAQLFSEYFGLRVIPPADVANFTEISAVGQIVFKNKEQAKFPASSADMKPPVIAPVFVQAEFYPDVSMNEFRFSIRSSDLMRVSGAVLSLFKFFVNPTS